MGTPFLRRITLQGHATPASKSSAKKIERRQAAYKPVALTLRHVQWVNLVVIAVAPEDSRPLSFSVIPSLFQDLPLNAAID